MATHTGKAKRVQSVARPLEAKPLPRKVASSPPSGARSTESSSAGRARELVDKGTRVRLEEELDAALKRKPTNEAKLAGALRAAAALSPALRGAMAEATQVLIRRGSFSREIYGACIRTLAESGDKQAPALIKSALAAEDAGGNATLGAACFCKDPSLTAPLAKLAASRQSHLAFGAETARVCRGESNGGHLSSVAPMIKESHRISLCVELFVPLTRGAPVSALVGPALSVLRGAERHLGRWLVLADVSVKAGDLRALDEAVAKSTVGPSSARSAWSLVAWALAETRASVTPGAPPVAAPTTRPTVELVARLSDRPSADRDTTFLFRMARSRAASCKPMLEGIVKGAPGLADEVSARAASFLVRDHGRADLQASLVETAVAPKRDELRGFAVAALWDTGDAALRDKARELCDDLATSRTASNVVWGALVRAAHAGAIGAADPLFLVAAETQVRWVQWGWLE